MTTIPRLETHLPELVQFIRQLANECQSGAFPGWRPFIERVRGFYTPAMMDRIEPVVPGWGEMTSYADQQTLIHVTGVLTALFLLPEYQLASSDEQALMMWMVLFHDVAKRAQPGKHDYTHAFRSAAIAGKALAGAGFPVTEAYPSLIEAWFRLTHQAIIYHEGHQEDIQDNRKLPDIISGIDRLFGVNAPAGGVIKAVLLHLSIPTDPSYPLLAPLTDDQIQAYLDAQVFPLLKAMMLVDNDGWNLFDAETRLHHRKETLEVFDRIGESVGLR